jgi:hypothetical protein
MQLKVDANEVVPAIEVVENNKVDINIIYDQVVPASINKEKGKALEAIEATDVETASCVCFISYISTFSSDADIVLKIVCYIR